MVLVQPHPTHTLYCWKAGGQAVVSSRPALQSLCHANCNALCSSQCPAATTRCADPSAPWFPTPRRCAGSLARAYANWYATKDKTKQASGLAAWLGRCIGRGILPHCLSCNRAGMDLDRCAHALNQHSALASHHLQTWDDAKRAAWNTWRVRRRGFCCAPDAAGLVLRKG